MESSSIEGCSRIVWTEMWNIVWQYRLDLWPQYWNVHHGVWRWMVQWIHLCGYLLSSRTILITSIRWVCVAHIFGYLCLIARFNFDLVWPSTITVCAVGSAYAHSVSGALGTLGPRNSVEKKILRVRVQRVRIIQVQVYHCMFCWLSLVEITSPV